MVEARKVGIAHGWMWLKQGLWLFKQHPFLWMVLTSILVVGMVGISTFPVVGGPLSEILFPSFFAGLMLGCHALAKEEKLELMHFFSGFRKHATPLLTLGGINLVGGALILVLLKFTGAAPLLDLLTSDNPPDDQALLQALLDAGWALPTGLVLSFLLQACAQFASMLVVFREVAPIPAMTSSLRAILRNAWPLSVYGLLLFPLAIVASVPMMLGWLVLLPIIITSQYATYRDFFPMEGDVPAEQQGDPIAPDNHPPSA